MVGHTEFREDEGKWGHGGAVLRGCLFELTLMKLSRDLRGPSMTGGKREGIYGNRIGQIAYLLNSV